MLIVKDGLILSVSRRDDKTKFCFLGGKCEPNETTGMAAIRETFEETGINVTDCVHIYDLMPRKPPASCWRMNW
jgi:8-oxo-dGTP pyrophosphatase MutT (NUDIX family)